MAPSKIYWPPEKQNQLRLLWRSPRTSLREMGEAMGCSPEACHNEAKRLGLPSRSSIRPGQFQPTQASVTRAHPLPPGVRTLPLLPSEMAALGSQQQQNNTEPQTGVINHGSS